MIAALQQFQSRFVDIFSFEIVDNDRYPALEDKWGDKVPVLLDGDTEIFRYFFDASKLVLHLEKRA